MSVQLGKYQLVAEIARGGMGIVYLAVAQGPARFAKLLVVKELKPEFVEDESFLDMFLEEARLAARLSHQNIVQTYEVGEENHRHYIVMDYLDGVTLARVVRRKSEAFTRNLHLRVICEILQGLHYAHTLKDFDGSDLGIVHRDVTPQNVFITFDGTAKVVDFGIAKALDSTIETRTGVLKGKPAYMAPEQIGGDVDPRADVFSAGVMVWEAVARQRMWSKKGDVEVLASMLRGEVPSIREYVPDVPEPLALIVERALLKDRDARYESAAALQADLEKFLESDPLATMREVGRVVGEIFVEERLTTRGTIETHLARLKAGAGYQSERLPSLTPPPDTSRTPTFGPSSEGSLMSAGTPAGSAFSMPQQLATFSQPVPSPANRKTPFIIAAVALLLTLVGFLFGLSRDRGRDGPTANPGPSATESVALNQPPEPAPAPPPVVEAPKPPATVSAAPPEKPRVTSPPPVRPVWQPQRPQPPPPRPSNTSTTSAPETRVPDSDRTGYLTLDTYPWTRVSMGGRVLGDTPLVHIPIAAGTHVLTLENSNEKVRTTTVVTIKAGETFSRRLAF